jgi:hypothetical protein
MIRHAEDFREHEDGTWVWTVTFNPMVKETVRDERFRRTDAEAKRVILKEAEQRTAKSAKLKALRLEKVATSPTVRPKRDLRDKKPE